LPGEGLLQDLPFGLERSERRSPLRVVPGLHEHGAVDPRFVHGGDLRLDWEHHVCVRVDDH
jgi:hypothetical protein